MWLQGAAPLPLEAAPYLPKYKTPMKTWDTVSICDLQIVDIYQNVRPRPNTGVIDHL